MNSMVPFTFEGSQVRIMTDETGNPWFNANDVCEVLGFGNPRQALESHVDSDDVQKLDIIDSLGRTQQANHLNESGVYALIFGSTKEEAKRFKRWVTAEVLPTLRKTGQYELQQAKVYRRQASLEWQKVRHDGKETRQFLTDAIQEFVGYATAKGSKSSDRYYMAITKMINKEMFGVDSVPDNFRDVLTASQIRNLMKAENLAQRAIFEGMATQLPYKEVFQLIKKRVVCFIETVGRSLPGFEQRLLLPESIQTTHNPAPAGFSISDGGN